MTSTSGVGAAPNQVSQDAVERTIVTFTKLDERGDRDAMNKLAMRLQKEQPALLQFAAQMRTSHGEKVGEAAIFYATLMWAMFDKSRNGETLPRLSNENLQAAAATVQSAFDAEGLASKAPAQRLLASLAKAQPFMVAKLQELLEEDLKEAAMTEETCGHIIAPTQTVIEAFDAALTGRRPAQRQGTIVNRTNIGRNDPCLCGSGKKYKKCCGAV